VYEVGKDGRAQDLLQGLSWPEQALPAGVRRRFDVIAPNVFDDVGEGLPAVPEGLVLAGAVGVLLAPATIDGPDECLAQVGVA
jgi:hypothetical protein